MWIFGKKQEFTLEKLRETYSSNKDALSDCKNPLIINGQIIHISIWYVFKDGTRIDLNAPNLIIKDWSGKYGWLRQQGLKRICKWEKMYKYLPCKQMLKAPEIEFYE